MNDNFNLNKYLYNNPLTEEELNEMDINDPMLMKLRADKEDRKKEREKQAALKQKDDFKKTYLNKKYGTSWSDKFEAEMVLKQQLDDLKSERKQIMIDMEQEAEPEGGEVADNYGSRLNDIDSRMKLIMQDLDDLRMYESVNEGTSVKKGDYVLYKGDGTKWVKSKIMQIIPSKRKLHIDWNDEHIEVDVKDVKPVEESVNEARGRAGEELSMISKRRAKASLRMIKSGKRDDGMGKFDAKLYGVDSDGKEHEIKDESDLNKYQKFGLRSIEESINENIMVGVYDLAKKSKDIESFRNAWYSTYSRGEQDIDADTDEWLETIYKRVNSVNEQSDQWTQGDVNDVNKVLRLTIKTLNNYEANLARLKDVMDKQSNKPQGDMLRGMVPDFSQSERDRLVKLYNAWNAAFSKYLEE
jgi:hypothetical protein